MKLTIEIDIRKLANTILSGFVSYLAVHFLLLPQLAAAGISFPTYFYIGVAATGVFAVVLSLALRPFLATTENTPDATVTPAE